MPTRWQAAVLQRGVQAERASLGELCHRLFGHLAQRLSLVGPGTDVRQNSGDALEERGLTLGSSLGCVGVDGGVNCLGHGSLQF